MSTRRPVAPASMLFARSASRSSGCTMSSHLRVLRGMDSSWVPINAGNVSDQLSNEPSGPVITWASLAMSWARRSPASRSCRRSRAISSAASV